MADTDQYPHTTALRKILPTLSGYGVTKFEPEQGYREEEEIPDEIGALVLINGVDNTISFDIEMWVHPGSATPTALTALSFVAPTSANALPILGTEDTIIPVLVVGKVKQIGEAGKVAKVGFKAIQNANLPTRS